MHISLALARGEGVVLLNLNKLSHIFIPQLQAHAVGFTLTLLGGDALRCFFFPLTCFCQIKGMNFLFLYVQQQMKSGGLLPLLDNR